MVKKMKPCKWCGRLFRQIRESHIYCCLACHNADHNSTKNKPIPPEHICPQNKHLICEVHNCSKCGWNPEVSKARLEAILAKMKEAK